MSQNNLLLKENIIERLKTLPVCKPNSSMRNWTVRCPYCGDSKTANHGHFSILIDLGSDAPLLYQCFRCQESGILNSQVLEDLGIFDNEISKQLKSFNFKASNASYFRDKIKNFTVPMPTDTLENARKLDYINRRLGVSLTYEDCVKYKIVLSFVDFFNVNHIPIATKHESLAFIKRGTLQEIEKNYVGFLSSNNNNLTCRAITDKGFFGRYYKITLDLLNRSQNSFYSLVSQFNLLYTDKIDVHIAEGIFDILSVYLNLDKDHSQNSLYFAAGKFNFAAILKYIIYMGVTTDINLHIYADNDKTDDDIRKVLQKPLTEIWIDKVILHRNTFDHQKDFGVPKSMILDTEYTLTI